MTVVVWRIATITPDYGADDLAGAGAKKTGGRWNRPGLPVLYCASTRALAALETVVHLAADALPLNRYLVQIGIPKKVFDARETLTATTAPVGWDALPVGIISLDFGDKWLTSKRSAVIEVPSIVVPEESNILINPEHTDAAKITAKVVRKWVYDARITK